MTTSRTDALHALSTVQDTRTNLAEAGHVRPRKAAFEGRSGHWWR